MCCSSIEDDIHFIINCCKLDIIRQEIYAEISSIYPDFYIMNDIERFTFIMSSHDYDINKMCITFVFKMYELRHRILKA